MACITERQATPNPLQNLGNFEKYALLHHNCSIKKAMMHSPLHVALCIPTLADSISSDKNVGQIFKGTLGNKHGFRGLRNPVSFFLGHLDICSSFGSNRGGTGLDIPQKKLINLTPSLWMLKS